MFWRQLKFAEFDVSEMSMSSLTIATSQGPTQWVALPVFTTREFFHLRILVRAASGIQAPADLKGKRVGVPEYQQTAAIWSRGVLQHEFGVHPRDIELFMERTPETSHGGATGFKPPEGVTVHQIPPTTNIGEMMVRGELDATLLYLTHANLVDRSRIDLANDNRFKPLFDRAAEAKRYFAKTGIYQINHGMVIRRSIFERHPWAALNIYNAFAKARGDVIRARDTVVAPAFRAGPDWRRRAPGARDRPDGLRRQRQPQGAGDHHAIRPRAGPHRAPRGARGDVRAEHDGFIKTRRKAPHFPGPSRGLR